MFTRTFSIVALASLILVLVTIGQANAVPTKVVHVNSTQCDPLLIPLNVDEIGDFTFFPTFEQLSSDALTFHPPVCGPDNTNFPNHLIEMTNLSLRDLEEVWYIANEETRISNFDGLANDIAFPISAVYPGQEAFRIDNDISDPGGIHHPLVSESIAVDGIWQAGETWQFVLQDYGNALGIGPEVFTSIGVGNASSAVAGTTPPSSGSIIATPVIPEPSSIILVLTSVGGLGSAAAGHTSMRQLSC